MRVAQILRRTVVVGTISTMLGVGMAVTATPAHAMPRECVVAHQMGVYWYGMYLQTYHSNRPLAQQYLATSEAYFAHFVAMGC